MADRVYLSPHLDDAVFSCGGVIYQQTSLGEDVLVVTICAGEPPTDQLSPFAQGLHERWGIDQASVEVRREEDLHACARLGAQVLHLPVPEAIYRLGTDGTPFYASEEAIFGELHPSEDELQDQVAGMLASMLAGLLEEICLGDVPVYVPTGYGGHVDHHLLRGAVSRLEINALYYRDFPYAMRGMDVSPSFELPSGEEVRIRLLDHEIRVWAEAVKEYESQLSTFWTDIQTIEGELQIAHDQMGGIPFLSST